jgi:ABC-2 type transport system ATP-binding protein
MTVPVIVTDRLAKRYGRIEALRGVSLSVERGEIFALLGQNGAGKTTLIKVLLGLTRATAGSALLLGASAGVARIRRRIGYLPEDHHFPDYHTGASLMDFYGALLEVPGRLRRERIPRLLQMVGLKGRMHSKVRTYSKGMKQRLGIAQALLNDPEVVFFDEPTDGVDPIGRKEIRDLMQALKAQGKTIFLNSHLLGEVEMVSDRVAILSHGDLIRIGSVATLTQLKGMFIVGLAPGQAFPRDEARQMGYEAHPAGEFWEVSFADGKTIDPLVGLIHSRGLSLRHLVEKRQTLEELFVATVEGHDKGAAGAARVADIPRPADPRIQGPPAEIKP